MLRQLFDTFTGATRPSEADRDWTGRSVLEDEWVEEDRADAIPVAQVDAAMASTGYNRARFHYVEGDVRETLPARAPDAIGLLRLDTDYYDSTLHELTHLYPRLAPAGVLIIDDYGHYQGSRQAVDEYLAGAATYLSRIDYSARLAIKPHTR